MVFIFLYFLGVAQEVQPEAEDAICRVNYLFLKYADKTKRPKARDRHIGTE